ncbi:MAG: phosphoglucomutase/phosphomannomutase family protein, partial [Balneolaceae bacterium]
GWRAVIAKDYTFSNLNIVIQATARWIMEEKITNNGVVIGYDARFLGKEFAQHTASMFAAMQIPVRIADSITPTPAISLAALKYQAVGIVITASHNPPEYNGFKIKAPYGGPATPDQIGKVEEQLRHFDPNLNAESYQHYLKSGRIREMPFTAEYLKELKEKIDVDHIIKSGIRIGHDPMFGAGKSILRQLFEGQVYEIHGESNPGFNGISPEPIEKNLEEFAAFIPRKNCAVGIANDGDADRIAMFDEKGHYVDSHRILSLLLKYLHCEKGLGGSVVKTFSTTNMLDKQAEVYGLPVKVTPIGFKYIAEIILKENVLVGGEESGGIAVNGHIPERDGIYIGLLITEMMVKSGKKLSELVQELFDEFGPHAYYRSDLHTENHKKEAMMHWCTEKKIKELAGLKVKEWQFTDGIKHIMEDDSWLLVRPSGTEPVLRIYAESTSELKSKKLVDAAASLVDHPDILQ